jgi:hypothetical protein
MPDKDKPVGHLQRFARSRPKPLNRSRMPRRRKAYHARAWLSLVARDDWPAKLCFELFDDLEGPNGCAADEVGICIYMSVAANDCSPIIRLNSDHLTNRQEPRPTVSRTWIP